MPGAAADAPAPVVVANPAHCCASEAAKGSLPGRESATAPPNRAASGSSGSSAGSCLPLGAACPKEAVGDSANGYAAVGDPSAGASSNAPLNDQSGSGSSSGSSSGSGSSMAASGSSPVGANGSRITGGANGSNAAAPGSSDVTGTGCTGVDGTGADGAGVDCPGGAKGTGREMPAMAASASARGSGAVGSGVRLQGNPASADAPAGVTSSSSAASESATASDRRPSANRRRGARSASSAGSASASGSPASRSSSPRPSASKPAGVGAVGGLPPAPTVVAGACRVGAARTGGAGAECREQVVDRRRGLARGVVVAVRRREGGERGRTAHCLGASGCADRLRERRPGIAAHLDERRGRRRRIRHRGAIRRSACVAR